MLLLEGRHVGEPVEGTSTLYVISEYHLKLYFLKILQIPVGNIQRHASRTSQGQTQGKCHAVVRIYLPSKVSRTLGFVKCPFIILCEN